MQDLVHCEGSGPDDDALICLEGLSVGFEGHVVFRELAFDVPRRGLVAIMGPGGVGKTTLLRTLGRWNEALPSFWVHGEILLNGRDFLREVSLDEAQRLVPLLAQKARLYTASVLDNAIAGIRGEAPLSREQKRGLAHGALEPLELWEEFEQVLDEPVLSLSIGRQRMLSIARLTAPGSLCLLVDEPLRDLSESEASAIEDLLSRLRERQAIVMVTHDQRAARRMADQICLITAGRLVEKTPSQEFFEAPCTELGREFIRSGNCWPTAEAPLEPDAQPSPWTPTPAERVVRPGGFHWVLRESLGGMQWPGLLSDERSDLAALAELGVGVLVSLTETPFDPEKLAAVGIRAEHFPIVDMEAPSLEDAAALCERISSWLDDGTPVVLHCKAGLGRTGTMLACALVHRGLDAVQAIHRVRCTNPRYIQSDEQLAFVGRFADHLGKRRARLA